jgi:hypothetical protein
LAKRANRVHENQFFGDESVQHQPEQADAAVDRDHVADIRDRDPGLLVGALQAQADQRIVALFAAVTQRAPKVLRTYRDTIEPRIPERGDAAGRAGLARTSAHNLTTASDLLWDGVPAKHRGRPWASFEHAKKNSLDPTGLQKFSSDTLRSAYHSLGPIHA